MKDFARQIEQAEQRIRVYIRETPLEYSHTLSAKSGTQVYFKLENVQHTGSFKFRGAINKMLALEASQRAKGVVAASSGNHGMAVAYAAKLLGCKAAIFVAKDASSAKVARIRQLGGHVEIVGDNCVLAEQAARSSAAQTGCAYVSPYNDSDVIAGQGSIGVELLRQTPMLDAVFVSIGGGGLIAGIGSYLKAQSPAIEVVGCQPENSRVMYESIRAGEIIDFPEQPTLSDGTAGGIEKDSVTYALCREVVDRYVLTPEHAIADAMRHMLAEENWLVEGAAGVAVAAFMQQQKHYRGKTVALLICGRNIAFDKIRAVFANDKPSAEK